MGRVMGSVWFSSGYHFLACWRYIVGMPGSVSHVTIKIAKVSIAYSLSVGLTMLMNHLGR